MNLRTASTRTSAYPSMLPLLPTSADVMRVMESAMRNQRVGDRTVEILEAGCGSRWGVKLDGLKYRVTGVDMDAAAVSDRMARRKDLDEVVIGDLRTVDLGSLKFDVIYNSFVLEHVPGAEALLERFVGWLRPGGIILIRVPDRDSVQGLITRLTPHWFHVWYYRFVCGSKTAGQPGHAPYRTIYDPVVSRAGMHAFATQHGLVIEAEYGSGGSVKGNRPIQFAIRALTRVVSILTLGRFSDRHGDLTFILRLPSRLSFEEPARK